MMDNNFTDSEYKKLSELKKGKTLSEKLFIDYYYGPTSLDITKYFGKAVLAGWWRGALFASLAVQLLNWKIL